MVSKPEKPRPDFPLFAHNNGQWAKKILQKMWYFGPWEDPAAAEAAYNSQAKDLHAGKKPRPAAEQCTLEFLCDAFMTYNDEQLQAGQMKEVTHKDYRDMCVDILKLFGKARLADQEDFRKFANDMVKRGLGPATRGTAIARVKRLFNFGVEDGILSESRSTALGSSGRQSRRWTSSRPASPKSYSNVRRSSDSLGGHASTQGHDAAGRQLRVRQQRRWQALQASSGSSERLGDLRSAKERHATRLLALARNRRCREGVARNPPEGQGPERQRPCLHDQHRPTLDQGQRMSY